MNQPITADLIAVLADSPAIEPILIRFLDDGSLYVIPSPHLTNISWTDYGRTARQLASLAELHEWLCSAEPLPADLAAYAEAVTESEMEIIDGEEQHSDDWKPTAADLPGWNQTGTGSDLASDVG